MKTVNIDRLETICNTKLIVFQKQAIYGWAKEFEDTVKSELERLYKQNYEEDLGRGINHFIIAIAFVLHFGEATRLGRKRLSSVLRDIQATVDMFEKREYTAKDYVKMLKEDKIDIKVKWN